LEVVILNVTLYTILLFFFLKKVYNDRKMLLQKIKIVWEIKICH